MLISFITDLHTGLGGELAHGIDLRQNFTDTLQAVSQYSFDYLVIGGDLCLHEGNSEIYQWQKEQLDLLGKPYFIIAGNHDDQLSLSRVFSHLPLTGEAEIYYELSLDKRVFLFLDTARGTTSDLQKTWLSEKLKEHHLDRVTIFMHHPPAVMGVPHMDQKHALQDHAEIREILTMTSNQKDIFCGHYHVEKSAFFENISIHITPSLFFQINQYKEEFAVDHLNIGFRMIEFNDQGMMTWVHYLPGTMGSNNHQF